VKFILAASIALLLPTLAFAEPNCNKTRWPLVDTTVTFGMSEAAATAAAKKKFGAKVTVMKTDTAIIVNFQENHQELLDSILYAVKGGVVTRIIFSYSNSFQASLGGVAPTLFGLAKKMIGKVGEKADKVENSGGEFLARWEPDNGAAMEIWGKDPNTAVMRFICETLEASISKSMVESTNFGF
jgi:hypothetical protein